MKSLYKSEIYVDDYLKNTHNRNGVLLKQVKGKILHGTANFGVNADAIANKNYFQRTDRYASSQEITDENGILRTMPNNEVAWHVGGKRYTELGKKLMVGGYSPNYSLIGEEICVHKNGNFAKTLKHSLISSINMMNEFGFTENEIWRHLDITGKSCPSFMMSDEELNEYRQRARYLYSTVFGKSPTLLPPVIIPEIMIVQVQDFLNVRQGPGIEFGIEKKLKNGDMVTCYEIVNNYFHIGNDLWVHSKFVVEANRPIIDEELPANKGIKEVYELIAEPYAFVYEEPRANSKIKTKEYPGEMITVISFVADWAKTSFGYIHMTDLKSTKTREIIRMDGKDVLYQSPNIGAAVGKFNKAINPMAVILDTIDMNNMTWEVLKMLERDKNELFYRQK